VEVHGDLNDKKSLINKVIAKTNTFKTKKLDKSTNGGGGS
jgi:hypothetical protein